MLHVWLFFQVISCIIIRVIQCTPLLAQWLPKSYCRSLATSHITQQGKHHFMSNHKLRQTPFLSLFLPTRTSSNWPFQKNYDVHSCGGKTWQSANKDDIKKRKKEVVFCIKPLIYLTKWFRTVFIYFLTLPAKVMLDKGPMVKTSSLPKDV